MKLLREIPVQSSELQPMTSIRVTDPRRETVGQVDLRRRQLPSGVTRCWSWQGPTNGRTTSEVDPIPWPNRSNFRGPLHCTETLVGRARPRVLVNHWV